MRQVRLDDQMLEKERQYGAKAMAYCQKTTDLKEARQVIKPGMVEWSSWERYFVDHLGFTPVGMKMVTWGKSKGMTVPAQWPEWFDPSYDRNVISQQASSPPDVPRYVEFPVDRANLFVGSDKNGYQRMVDMAKNAPTADFHYSDDPPGIWVPVAWWLDPVKAAAKSTSEQPAATPYTDDEIRAIYGKSQVP